MSDQNCPECSGDVIHDKGSLVCSKCGLVIECHVVSNEMCYGLTLDHAPLKHDLNASKIFTFEYHVRNRDYLRLQHRINQRFRKKVRPGYYHCPRCGLPVSKLNGDKKHFCTFEPFRKRAPLDEICIMYRSGKNIFEIASTFKINERTVKYMLVKNGLIERIGTGNTRCKKCGAIMSSGHGKDFHVCGSQEHEKKRHPVIDDKIPCFFHDLGSCGGKFKTRVVISGKHIAQELGISYYTNAYRYSEDIISQLNDQTRFVVCCIVHANIIRSIRGKNKSLSFQEIIEKIKNK
jgi:hypothetical protein